MTCPNCGLANPDTAKFCANCGTSFVGTAGGGQSSWQGQASYEPPLPPPPPPRRSNPVAKNIALGCLVALLIFFFLGLSCTRACFRPRRYYRRYGAVLHYVAPPVGSVQIAG
jgi:uncharacterized membrane protein YvbJ